MRPHCKENESEQSSLFDIVCKHDGWVTIYYPFQALSGYYLQPFSRSRACVILNQISQKKNRVQINTYLYRFPCTNVQHVHETTLNVVSINLPRMAPTSTLSLGPLECSDRTSSHERTRFPTLAMCSQVKTISHNIEQ